VNDVRRRQPSRRDLGCNAAAAAPRGNIVTPSHNPPDDGG
jgi:phosphoglucomutase